MFSEKIQKTKGQSTDESILKHVPNLLHNLRLRRKKDSQFNNKRIFEQAIKRRYSKGQQTSWKTVDIIHNQRNHDPLSIFAKVKMSSITCCMFGVYLEVHCHHHQVVKSVLQPYHRLLLRIDVSKPQLLASRWPFKNLWANILRCEN